MYAASQAFHAAMRADLRRVDARVQIDWAAPEIDPDLSVSANENGYISYPQQVADTIDRVTHKWASLDGTWRLDQDYRLAPLPEDLYRYQFGWWSASVAGADGAFAAPYPTIILTHLPRPIYGLRVVGDTARGEWPVDFEIRLRDANGSVVRTVAVTGNNEVDWSQALDEPAQGITQQELEIRRWSHPGRCAKIVEFYTGIQEAYENEDLVEVRLLEEREVDQGSLPVGNASANEVRIRLADPTGKFNPTNPDSPFYPLFRPNRRIRVWLGAEVNGSREWVPMGTFWSVKWDAADDGLEATVVARDRLELLRRTTFATSTVQQNVSLYDLAQQVLVDAGLNAEEFWIDPALQQTVIPWAWLQPTSHREALRIIAEAALAVVYADRDGVVRIETIGAVPDTPVLEIAADDYFPPLQAPSKQESVANEIIVTTQPLVPAATPQEVYRSTTPITVPAGQTVTVTVQFTQAPVIEASASLGAPPAGVSITAATYYAWGAEVSIQNTSATQVSVTLVITGKPLGVQGGEQVVVRDDASILENGVLRYEYPANPLVQTLAQAQAIATALLASAKDPRRDIEVEWRGNPALELGDRVTVAGQDVHVIRQEIEWAGALSARLTGRKVT